uniref:Alternative protein CUL7 n=1 Tax=Homo sapiens TaxID=9606 RepID=L8E835_HUMAN|nr:alternative protein CUL7 [Homo sapiens]
MLCMCGTHCSRGCECGCWMIMRRSVPGMRASFGRATTVCLLCRYFGSQQAAPIGCTGTCWRSWALRKTLRTWLRLMSTKGQWPVESWVEPCLPGAGGP